MATMARERQPVVVSGEREMTRQRLLGDAWSANAARALWVAGILYLIGSLADVVLLLGFAQDWGNPYWEFTSLASTLEGTPRIVLAIALIWTAMYVRGTATLAAYRILSLVLIALGLAAAGFSAMVISDYFILRPDWDPQAAQVGLTILLKSLTLGALHVFLLVPIGVMGVRRPRA